MIGNLLFHVLYPITRFFNSRPSVVSDKALSRAVVNGTAEWDGRSVSIKLTQAQARFLLRSGETKERVNNLAPETKHFTRSDMDKKTSAAIPIMEAQRGMESTTTGLQSAFQSKKEVLEEDKKDIADRADDKSFTTDLRNSEPSLGEQLNSQQTEEKTREEQKTSPALKGWPMRSFTVSPVQPASSKHTISPNKQLPPQKREKTQTLAEAMPDKTECWDEYLAPPSTAPEGPSKSSYSCSPLPFSSHPSHEFAERPAKQPCWHFPQGPGLAQEMQCSRWNFPAMTYYAAVEPTRPFEVVWRIWEELGENTTSADSHLKPSPSTCASMSFTVMSYNILAQDLVELNPYLYTHCPREVLNWDHRFKLLMEEILKYAPDILCLQEVQKNHYYQQLQPALSALGYSCIYKCRTGNKTDGCAICYRSSCFSRVSFTKLEFFRPETKLLDRHNVGIVVLLQPKVAQGGEVKDTGPLLCVANTHLLFNPRRGDVKLAQLAIMLAEIDAAVKSCENRGEHCNVVFCGDFNSVPNMPLYQLIMTGELPFHGLPTWMVSGQEDLSYKPNCHKLFAPLWPSSLGITDTCQYTAADSVSGKQGRKSGKFRYSHDFMLQLRYSRDACVRPKDLVLIPGVTDLTPDPPRTSRQSHRFRDILRHKLKLESAYRHISSNTSSPEVTTLHSRGGATVDYIFYTPKHVGASSLKCEGKDSGNGLKLTGLLSLLSEDVLWSMNGLPNQIFPSDHLSLLARFRFDLKTPS